MPETNITIYPSLVIGLGGAGTSVVRNVKKRFRRAWHGDELEDLPTFLQLLAVDTEPLVNDVGEEPLYFHEFAYLGKFDGTRLVDNKDKHRPYLDWWQWDKGDIPLGYIHTGAKQLRPIGRLAFFRNYAVFKNMFIEKLEAMREIRSVQEAQERHFAVQVNQRLIYIVSSLCGGTGSGMFLDVAHRVRHQVGSQARIIGILLLPSVFDRTIHSDLQRRRIQANAYAALKELDHFHNTQDFRAFYPGEQVYIPATPYRAFDQIFLIERTNEDGRTLSSLRQVAQMAAHMIHLTAFSPLGKAILGQDVNVTQDKGAGLLYSSFGTSAIVMPRGALQRYFVSLVTSALLDRLAVGGEEFDVNAAYQDYVVMCGQLEGEMKKNAGSIDDLDALETNMRNKTARWLGFTSILTTAMREAMKKYGLSGAHYIIHRLTLKKGDAELRSEDFAHPEHQTFREPPSVPPAGLWARLSNSAEYNATIQAAQQRQAVYKRSVATWQLVLDELRILANAWEQRIGTISKDLVEASQVASSGLESMMADIDPLQRNQDPETATYYDLETGAMGTDYIGAYEDRINELLSEPVSAEETDSWWNWLYNAVHAALLPLDDTSALSSDTALQGAAAIQIAIEQILRDDLELDPLRRRLQEEFDIRHVVYVQHGENPRPPNHRVNQLMQRVSPFESVDGDIHQYSEGDQEHTRVIGTPHEMSEETGNVGRAFRASLRGYSQFETRKMGDPDRIDACHVVHGLPLRQISSMPELYRQYNGTDFTKATLHVDPSWVSFPEVYTPSAGEQASGRQATEGLGESGTAEERHPREAPPQADRTASSRSAPTPSRETKTEEPVTPPKGGAPTSSTGSTEAESEGERPRL